MDESLPAVDNAQTSAETAETLATATAPAVAESASTPVEPSPAPSKPDLASLLSDPEIKQELLKHPELRQEMDRELEHRFSSERGRVRAELKAQWELQEQVRQQQEAARIERERIETMDPYDLGVQEKERLARIKEEEALQEKLRPLQTQFQTELLQRNAGEIFGSVQQLAKDMGISEKELDEVDPLAFNSLGEFTTGVIKFLVSREAKRLAKDLAKIEAKAMLEDRAAATRESSPSPEALPAGEGTESERDFMAAFASGSRTSKADYERAMRSTGLRY